MGNATKKSIFDHSFPEKRLLHCQLLSEPKNLQSPLIFLGYVSLERALLILDQKYFLPNMLLFKNAPENNPYLGTDFFGVGLMGKLLPLVYWYYAFLTKIAVAGPFGAFLVVWLLVVARGLLLR